MSRNPSNIDKFQVSSVLKAPYEKRQEPSSPTIPELRDDHSPEPHDWTNELNPTRQRCDESIQSWEVVDSSDDWSTGATAPHLATTFRVVVGSFPDQNLDCHQLNSNWEQVTHAVYDNPCDCDYDMFWYEGSSHDDAPCAVTPPVPPTRVTSGESIGTFNVSVIEYEVSASDELTVI